MKNYFNHPVLLLVMVFIGFLNTNAQNTKQLLKSIDTVKTTSTKVKLLTDLAWEYTNLSNDSSLIYSNKALKLSQENNYPFGKAIALENIGLYHEIIEGDFEVASKNYFEALKICEENNLEYQAEILHTIGIMFHMTDNYNKGKEYYELSYKKALENKNLSLQKKSLINLGAVYSSLGEQEKAEKTMLQTLEMAIHPEMDYTTYANLGYYYVKQQNYIKALPYLEKATQQSPDNPESEINLYHLINAKVKANDITGMASIIERAKAAVKTVSSIRDKSLLLRNIADYYQLKGDYKEAVEFRNAYIEVFEEIKEKQRDQIVNDLETKYETEKKDSQVKLLTAEKEKKEQQNKLYLSLLIGGLLVLSLVGYFGYKNRQKNLLLDKQKTLLEVALSEKNTLLKEIHHRVKNSFQIVSSLLYLQSENADDTQAKTAIKEAENRVRSMILIHQKLYNKDELVGINLQEYIGDLTKDIVESHLAGPDSLKTEIDVAPIVLDIETITPLGLILNELITNVIKHAYTDIDDKLLQLKLHENNNQLILQVIDNGTGITKKPSESSFGITLMKALSKKLKANLVIQPRDKNSGTIASLSINKYTILS